MKQKILFLLLPALLFVGCSSDDDGLSRGSGDRIQFEIGFAPTGGGSWTRAATGADFKTEWEAGDEIGLFAVKSGDPLTSSNNPFQNMRVSYDGTNWNGAYWANDENKGEDLDFYAYYPYDAGMTDPTSHTFSVKSDQRAETDYNHSDLLLAQAVNVAKGTGVSLQFSHALSLVQVEIKREINVPHFDDDLTVTLKGSMPGATLDWMNALTGTGSPTDIVMHKVEGMDHTYRALVPAQTLPDDSKVTFVQSTTGKEIDMEYHGMQSMSLTAAHAHKYSVTLGWDIDPEHEYAVGDKYPHIGRTIGIVYEISNGGKNGKVVSLDELTSVQWADDSNWNVQTNVTDRTNGRVNMLTMSNFITSQSKAWSNFPAFDWVHTTKNRGTEDYSQTEATGIWYLPAWGELSALYNAYNNYGKSNFNDRITDADGTSLSNTYYWSSSEYDNLYAYVVSFSDGSSVGGFKSYVNRARCVLAF